jgi:molybdate transport system regulatory protein
VEFRVKSKFWIEDDHGRPVLGAGRTLILETIAEHGSIKAAADALGMSYRAVWGKIKSAEEHLGLKLVETRAGGGPSRGASLTPDAERLLNLFHELHEQGNRTADEIFRKVFQDGIKGKPRPKKSKK